MRVNPLVIEAFVLLVLIAASWQVYAARKAVRNGFQPTWLFVVVRAFNMVAIFIVAVATILYFLGLR